MNDWITALDVEKNRRRIKEEREEGEIVVAESVNSRINNAGCEKEINDEEEILEMQ